MRVSGGPKSNFFPTGSGVFSQQSLGVRYRYQQEFAGALGDGGNDHIGFSAEATDLIVASMEKAIAAKAVTYDFARLMGGATEVKRSAFAVAMVAKM
jgi:hypothetical protein